MFSRFFSSLSANKNNNDNDEESESSAEEAENASDIDDESEDQVDGQISLDLGKKQKKTSKAAKLDKSGQDNPLLPEELCEIPTFLNTACCDKELIEETRNLLKKKYLKNPELFSQVDYQRMLDDDWAVSRFLLRCRLNPKAAAKLMKQCGKFRLEYRMGISKLSDFPIEFHRAGGLFKYAPDRVGNQTIFMRIKMHRRIPELGQIMREFILCCLEECDRANNGRGTAVIFDLTGCGIQNIDLGFLFWLVYSFRNYCPKGLSYIIVYNLPWILNATAKLALSWLSSTNRKRLRFVSGDGIQDFIAPENLPDYLGGSCKLNYRQVPEGSKSAEDTAAHYNLTKEQSRKIKEVYEKFLKEVDDDIQLDQEDVDQSDSKGEDRASKSASLISSSLVAS